MRVLIVEDQADLAQSIARVLAREGMEVELAYDGESGLSLATAGAFDVVILDRDLPLLGGDDICRALVAERSASRLMMLTAASDLDDRVAGLSLGADDYLTKPFALAELIARVRALGRRDQPAAGPLLTAADIRLDTVRRTVLRGGQPVDLSAKEIGVLEVLLAAEGAVVSAEELLDRAWDHGADPFSDAVKVTISRLRRKLGDPPVITTVPHAGYRIPADGVLDREARR